VADLRAVVVVGPGLDADPDLLAEVAAAEFAALGVSGRVVATDGTEGLDTAIAAAGRDPACALVALPGPGAQSRRLMEVPGPRADRTVWLDLGGAGPVPPAAGAAHLHGRGLWGLTWAIRHAVHRLRHPARRIAYGDHPDQWGDLRLPPGDGARPPGAGARPPGAGARPPVAVLVHGGYWRSVWGADLMDALAADLAGRGFAAWNLEYRRPDRHGWAATVDDVDAALAALDLVAAQAPVDPDRVVLIGHSAGGQLAVRAAADHPDRVAVAVSLAGVLDLHEAQRRGMGTGAVAVALGGTPAELPALYAAADPMARLPFGVPQLVVQGRDDDLDLVDLGRRYVRRARAAGDAVTQVELPGDHFAVIDPRTPIWRATTDAVADLLARHRDGRP
jgi:acetyl esterase/lipase